MKTIRTASFAGREFRFWEYDAESISQVPGFGVLKTSAANCAQATAGTFADEAAVRDRHWQVAPGEVVLDVGPAFGSYTLTAAAQGARVFAFEPCTFCRTILEDNVAANPDLAPLVTVLAVGVHERSGWFDPDAGTFSDRQEGPACFPVRSFDDAAGLIGRVDYVKLDIEGAELGALRGGERTIRASLPRLLVEEHEFLRRGIGAECEAVLRSYGYGAPYRVNHHAVEHSFYRSPR
jgi:FkbM family methyltransferase